jgi:hypothetical protein
VVNVELVRAYGQLVRLVLRRGKLVNALQLAVARLQRAAGEVNQREGVRVAGAGVGGG